MSWGAVHKAALRLILSMVFTLSGAQASQLLINEAEITKLVRHGPWPPPLAPDPSNRVSGDHQAIALGRELFFSPELSGNGNMACTTCHHPGRGWTDRLPRGLGTTELDRNTQSLIDVRFNRWFSWDGQNDNLWAQSIRPLVDPREMHSSSARVVAALLEMPKLAELYQRVFGEAPGTNQSEKSLINVGKALAAFQETLVSGRTRFDDFRDALARGDRDAAAAYPQDAQRGAALFFGRGNCTFCHTGPQFTNGEFQDAGVPYFIEPGRVDKGRLGGIAKLKASRWTLAGPHNDDPARSGAWKVRGVKSLPRNFGEFRVPTLRNLTQTAPYMHNGSLATLEDVVLHYSMIDIERLHADGTRILTPLHLNSQEIKDLVAFLETLSAR